MNCLVSYLEKGRKDIGNALLNDVSYCCCLTVSNHFSDVNQN